MDIDVFQEGDMTLRPAHIALVASMLTLAVRSPFSVSYGQDLEIQRVALSTIIKAANEICQSAPLETTNQEVNLSGSAATRLDGLIGQVTDLGIARANEYQSNRSMGVLQKDLITAIQSGNDCRLEVLRILEKRLLTGISAPQNNRNSPLPEATPVQKPRTAPIAPTAGAISKQPSLWNHNGSITYLISNGNSREIYYQQPRPGMVQAGAYPGSLLFQGEYQNGQYLGTAFIFNRTCGTFPYQVSGPVLDGYRRIVMYGNAPRIGRDCQIEGEVPDTLEFTLIQ